MTSSARERDILGLVIRSISTPKRKKKPKSGDLLEVSINLTGANENWKMRWEEVNGDYELMKGTYLQVQKDYINAKMNNEQLRCQTERVNKNLATQLDEKNNL